MRGKTWETSKRRYGIVHERNVSIPVSAGFTLDCDVLRPDAPGTFPCLAGFFPFEKALMLQFNFLNGLLSPENPKLARIAVAMLSSATRAVPKVSTSTLTGSAMPMA